jgi:hypothetical protein
MVENFLFYVLIFIFGFYLGIKTMLTWLKSDRNKGLTVYEVLKRLQDRVIK